MDTREFTAGNFLTADVVNKSVRKIGVILDEAKPVQTGFGSKMKCQFNLDGKVYVWNMNTNTVKNLQKAYGFDSNAWVGQFVQVTVLSVSDKLTVIGQAAHIPPVVSEDTIVHVNPKIEVPIN